MPTCSGCGGNSDDTFQFCPYCGKPKPKPQEPIKVDVLSHEPHSPLDCPKCHRIDNVSKVASIVQGGTHHINGQVPVSHTYQDSDGWHEKTSYESYNATQQSTLAHKLMPPEKPQKGGSLWALPLFMAAWIAVIMGMMSKVGFDQGRLLIATGLLFASIGALFGIWRIYIYTDRPYKEKLASDLLKWEYSLNRWQELYYCSRDDCIFFPGENKAVQTSSMIDMIDWHP